MVPEPILRLVPYLGTFILASQGEELRWCCPFCEKTGKTKDTGFHFYLRIAERKPGHSCKTCLGHHVCHRCGTAGRTLGVLYSRLGLVLDSDPPAPQDVYETVCAILSRHVLKAQRTVPSDIGLPEEYRPLAPDTLARKYVLSRGITPEEAEAYEIGIGTGRLDWRIVIPNRSETGYDMWQARWYHPVLESRMKYKTAPGALDSLVLFNRLRASRYSTIVVCEGPISAIVAGPNAVASWGKHLSPAHVELLVKMKAEEYWIAYDGDAVLDGLASASTLYARGQKVRYLRLPRKEDPASLGREAMSKIGRESSVFNEMTPALVLAGAA